jgi:hypothetical protein
MWTIGPYSCYGFAVRIFTIEVRLRIVVREIPAAFKGHGFLSIGTWLRRATLRSRSAFALAATSTLASRTIAFAAAHLGALFTQNRLA